MSLKPSLRVMDGPGRAKKAIFSRLNLMVLIGIGKG
jgi:hypothetical protein